MSLSGLFTANKPVDIYDQPFNGHHFFKILEAAIRATPYAVHTSSWRDADVITFLADDNKDSQKRFSITVRPNDTNIYIRQSTKVQDDLFVSHQDRQGINTPPGNNPFSSVEIRCASPEAAGELLVNFLQDNTAHHHSAKLEKFLQHVDESRRLIDEGALIFESGKLRSPTSKELVTKHREMSADPA